VIILFVQPYINYRDGEGLRLIIGYSKCDLNCKNCHLTKDENVSFEYILNLLDNIKTTGYL
jgi:pyruvate-formate lyase-activating enzyme